MINNDADALRPVRLFHHARSGLLIVLGVVVCIAVLQLCIPAATVSAASQVDAAQDGQITLQLPQFSGPSPQSATLGVPGPPLPQLKISEPNFATSRSNLNAASSGNHAIQIIPRNSGSRSAPTAAEGMAPVEPSLFPPTRRREARQSGHVSMESSSPQGGVFPLPSPSETQSPQVLLRSQTTQRPFHGQSSAGANQSPFVLPNTSRRLAQQANDPFDSAPSAAEHIPFPSPMTLGHAEATDVPQSQPQFDGQAVGGFNDIATPMIQAPMATESFNPGTQPQPNFSGAGGQVQDAKIPAAQWSVMPDESLSEANRLMEESFLRMMGKSGSDAAMDQGPTPPSYVEGNQTFGNETLQHGNVDGLNPYGPQPQPQPNLQQGSGTFSDSESPLMIPGFSDQPPALMTPAPHQDGAHSGSHGSPSLSPAIPMEAYGAEGQPSVPGQSLPQQNVPYDAPVYPEQHSVPLQPLHERPIQQGHSFPEPQIPMEQPSSSIAAPLSGAYSGNGNYPGTSGYRATGESDAPGWMSPYEQRARVADSGSIISAVRSLPPLPPGFAPWWDASVRQSTGPGGTSLPVDVGALLQDALLHSPQVNAIKAEPEVQYRVITQEAAKFDWTAFLETTYDDLNDPVGNTLTTATGEDRLLTRKFRGSGGVRRKNLHGGEFQIAQNIGHENQTSSFFIPNNQGTSRLEVSYRQPLLDGAGEAYNRSEIILASIAANASEDEVVAALQDHLIEVTEAYWALYRARAEFFQRQKLLTSANDVLLRLEGRSQVDTIPRQILRSRAAVARAQTRIQRTLARVEDAESQLRLLVNSPDMLTGGPIEVLPLEAPNMVTENANLQSVLQTALANRPDISEAIRKMRASTVRLGVSKKELLPRLDFLVESYVSDLAGSSDVGRALQGQFTDNRPGYTVGFELEIPLENRAAIAKMEQRQWELKRSMNVFRATVEKSLTDTEVARREVATAYSEIVSRYHSMMAAEQESRYLADRFTVLPASEDSATLLLEDLLDSFERLADEESTFVQAQVDHAVALVQLKKEMGVLLKSRNARPDVEEKAQTYMSDRLQASASRMKANGPTSSIAEPTSPGDESQSDASPQNTRVVGHQLGGPPVAGYTTTWKRPKIQQASQSRTLPSGGHSQ